MKILLINPRFNYVGKDTFPLGLSYIAAMAQQLGHEVQVIDENCSQSVPESDLSQYNLIGFSVTSPTFPRMKELIQIIREQDLFSGLFAAGGHHPTFRPEEVLRSGIDIVIQGEGEQTFQQLLLRIANGEDWHLLPGISFFTETGDLQQNPPVEFQTDLDQIPFPAWNLFEYSHYEPMSIITSRGCPFQCSYCAAAAFWHHSIRFRSVSNVIQELDALIQLYPYPLLKFQDSIFTVNRTRTQKLLKAMIDRQYPFQWVCETRADTLDEDLVLLMKQANCKVIMLGIESGDQIILDSNNRRMDVDQILAVSEIIQRQKIGLRFSVIFGLPGETAETVEHTLKLLRQIRPNITFLNLATIYPGCALEGTPEVVMNERWVQSIGGHGLGAPLAMPEGMTPKEYRRLANYMKREIGKINKFNWVKDQDL